LEYGRSTIFTVSVEVVTETEAAGIHKLRTTKAIAHTPEAKRSYCTSAMNNKNHDPQCLCPTCRRSCESAGEQGYKERQDKVLRMRNSIGLRRRGPQGGAGDRGDYGPAAASDGRGKKRKAKAARRIEGNIATP